MSIRTYDPLDESGVLLVSNAFMLRTLHVYNPATLSVAYIKFYDAIAPSWTEPNYDVVSARAVWAILPGNAINLNVAVKFPPSYIIASSSRTIGDNAPASDLLVTITYEETAL